MEVVSYLEAFDAYVLPFQFSPNFPPTIYCAGNVPNDKILSYLKFTDLKETFGNICVSKVDTIISTDDWVGKLKGKNGTDCSASRLGKIFHFGKTFNVVGNFLRVYLIFGQIRTSFGQIVVLPGKFLNS